jgi:hypothetical protein
MINIWAHVLIFVFFKEADNLEVNTELSFIYLEPPNKSKNSVVFFESGMDISSQIKGSIKIAKISYETFGSPSQHFCIESACLPFPIHFHSIVNLLSIFSN